MTADLAVLGGGAAGAAAALRSISRGYRVVLIEKSTGAPHKFCGEFLSGEAFGSLTEVGAVEAVRELGPVRINRMGLYGRRRAAFTMPLAAGGWGLTRQALDARLLALAGERGVDVWRGVEVENLEGSSETGFRIHDRSGPILETRAVIGAWGKRSKLDRALARPFLKKDSRYVGVKLHFENVTVADEVGLYLFQGGHCGLVSVPRGLAALGILARREALQAAGNPRALVATAIRNRRLEARLAGARPVLDSLLTIGQTPLMGKSPAAPGVFLAGDAAILTPPFLGLGVANALRTAVVAADCAHDALSGTTTFERVATAHQKWLQQTFGLLRLWSRPVSGLLCDPGLGDGLIGAMSLFPSIARYLYMGSRAGLRSAARTPA